METLKYGPMKVGKHCDPAKVGPTLTRELANLRRTHKRGLQAAWKTGFLVNQHLGPPTERLGFSESLKRVAEKLLTAEHGGCPHDKLVKLTSDLNWMGWFAHLFESVKDFQDKNPTTHSWKKVQELLVFKLIADHLAKEGKSSNANVIHDSKEKSSDVAGTGEHSPGNEQDTALGGILRSLSAATERLRQGNIHLGDAERKRLQKGIQRLVAVVSDQPPPPLHR